MRLIKRIVPPALLLASVAAQACGESPVDDKRTDRRLFQVKGVIQGTLTYTGQRPCSRNGHIVGSAILLVFDKRNPPPPAGLANTAVNFGVIPGDNLFANEPRNPQSDLYCPKDHGITDTILVSAPFDIAPMDDGQFIIQAFYDYTGNFLPTFKIRNLPEATDVIGGYVDAADAAKHAGDVNYQPIFLPVNIGYPDPKSASGSGFTIPDSGFVADNVPVTIGVTTPLARPYFYPAGADKQAAGPAAGSGEMDPNYVPVITMTQDYHVKAQPSAKTEGNINEQQDSFVQLDLKAGVPDAEMASASATTDPKLPFHFQTRPFAMGGGLYQWADPVKKIPETNLIPQVWPLVVFAKLQDNRGVDPQSLLAQGSKTDPVVIIQGLTVWKDKLFETTPFATTPVPLSPADPASRVDHVRVLIRPSVVCFNALAINQGGLLVTPFRQGDDPGSGPPERQIDIVDLPGVQASSAGLIRDYRIACMPKGRYGINVVYPTGQAWTVPNEAGSCANAEGVTQCSGSQCSSPNDFSHPEALQCSSKPRPVLYSQGTRAILEIVTAKDPANCAGAQAVPDECLPCSERQNAAKFPECAP